ncbi:MAG: FkbM family methyltransferase [Bacteroidia bacterium]|nr:FkbM family methyltransferase [Bacteroidia bacterium]
MTVIHKIKNRFFRNETDRIILAAHRFPRYSPHSFYFRKKKILVTDFLSVAYQLREIFAEERLRFPSPSVEPVIFDCGANVGIASLYFSMQYPGCRILSFEPDEKVFDCLKKNCQEWDIKNIALHKAAVWIDNQELDFGSEGADGGSLFQGENRSRVQGIRLSSMLEKESAVDLLKMDIEGAECDVIKDCRSQLHKVKYLFLEYHSWAERNQELSGLLQVLSDCGFRYNIHRVGKAIKSPFMTWNVQTGMDLQLDIHAIRT